MWQLMFPSTFPSWYLGAQIFCTNATDAGLLLWQDVFCHLARHPAQSDHHNLQPMGHMHNRIAMNIQKHKPINLLKTLRELF